MNKYKIILIIIICLIFSFKGHAQGAPEYERFHVLDAYELIKSQGVEKYFNEIEQQISKLVEQFPQLSAWNINKEDNSPGDGKIVTADNFIYAYLYYSHGLLNNSPDHYGSMSLEIDVRIYSIDDFDKLQGQGVNSIIYGGEVAGGRVVATVVSANPKDAKLEELISRIIKKGVIGGEPIQYLD